MEEWASLLATLPQVLADYPDTVLWRLSPLRVFSVGSGYHALCRRPSLPWILPLWKAPCLSRWKSLFGCFYETAFHLGQRWSSGMALGLDYASFVGFQRLVLTTFSLACGEISLELCPWGSRSDREALDLVGFLQTHANQTRRRRRLFWLVFTALT